MKVLVISLYGPPANNIAANRSEGYCTYLPENGIGTFLITRYFSQNSLNSGDTLIGVTNAGLDQDFIHTGTVWHTNFKTENRLLKISAKLPRGIRGIYNLHKVDIYHAGWLEFVSAALDDLTSRIKPDLAIVSYGPPVAFNIAEMLEKKYKIPYIIEFRDSYITEQDKGYVLSMKKRNLRRFCSGSKAFIFASNGVKDYFIKYVPKPFIAKPMHVLYHGFDRQQLNTKHVVEETDREVYDQFMAFKKRHKVVALFSGTLYGGQNIDFFIDGARTLNQLNKNTIGICLLGTYFDNRQPIKTFDNLAVLKRVSKNTSIEISRQSHLLLLPIWKNRYTGFMGKISEYCALQKPVAVGPDPQKDLQEYLKDNPNIHFFSHTTEFSTFIKELSEGKVPDIKLDVEKYTRQYQFSELARFLKKIAHA